MLKKILLSLSLVLLTASCCDNADKEKEPVAIDKANVAQTVLNVEGMTCEGCESTIQMNLSKMKGVVSVKASHVEKTTVVEYDKTQVSAKELEDAIISTGYKVFDTPIKEAKKEVKSAMKCAPGKCGAGKCGEAE